MKFFKKHNFSYDISVVNSLKKSLFILTIFNWVWLYAQHGNKSSYHVGLKLGYSFHTLTGDLTKSQFGQNFLGGFWFRLKLDERWTAQTEILLLDKGIGVAFSGRKSTHFVNLHYLEMPVLFQYHLKNLYFEFGLGLGYLINYREHLNGNQTPNLIYKYPFNRNELSFNLGNGWKLNEKWAIEIRFSHSLLPVRKAVPLVSKDSYNCLLALSLTRQLNLKRNKDSDVQ